MNFCKDCEFYRCDVYHLCAHPYYGLDYTTGETNTLSTRMARAPANSIIHGKDKLSCGPEGTFFKPKTIKPKPWWRIWE